MRWLRQLVAVLLLEWRHIARDRTSRALLIGVPILQLILFATTVNLDPRHVSLVVAGGTPDAIARAQTLIAESGRFDPVLTGQPRGAAETAVAQGRARVGIELPDAPDNADDPPGPPRIIIDAADPASVRPAIAALERAFLRAVISSVRLSGVPQIDLDWRYNPGLITTWAIIPGLIGAVVMISMLMLGALSLVREREQGTWEVLLATPVGRSQALIGKLSPYLLLGVTQSGLLAILAWAGFGVPLRGSLLLVLLAASGCAGCYLAIGFAISARARTSLQAIQAAIFLYLPSMLLSGFLFPFDGMPRWARLLGEAVPLTHFVRIGRDVMLRGASIGRVAPELAILAGLTLICATAAAILYRSPLD